MPAVRKTLAILVVSAAALPLCQVQAQQPALVVQLSGGRQLRGVIDERSTGEWLVLRTTRDNITVRRPIRWEQINALALDGQPVEVAALRLKAAAGGRGLPESGPGSLEQRIRKVELRGEAAPREPLPQPRAAAPLPEVSTLSFDAFVANWDADVETDGLVLDLAPLDADGFVVPAAGTLQVELFAPRRRVLHHAPLSGGDTLELVERWTSTLAADQIGPAGVRLRLAFGAVHPELDPEWLAWWYGLVHVRLAVPGHGVFEASRDGVRLRPWAVNRDNLEMSTGRRFLPTENLGRHN